MRSMSVLLALSALCLVSCEQKSGFTVGTESVECSLTLDQLPGTQWVMLEAHPTKGDIENPQARARFFMEDGKIKLDYTVKSLGDVYEYDCEIREAQGEIYCWEPANLQDWCQALEVNEQNSCTKETLEELGATGFTDAEYEEAIEKARKLADSNRGGDAWQMFKLENNNVGNKLQGRFYGKIDEKKCRLRVTDMYMTIYDGQVLEDSNPVGTNPFVQTEETFFWEHCDDGRNLLDWNAMTLPEDLSTIPGRRDHDVGTPVYYHYMGETALKPEEGCTYSMDLAAQWRPTQSGVSVEEKDGKLQWVASHSWPDVEPLLLVNPMQPTAIFGMARYKTCGGEKEKIDTVCNAGFVGEAPPIPPQ